MNKNFEKNIKPILKYIGTIGAGLMTIAYIGIILIMVFGFKATSNLQNTITFALINAIIGLVIMQFLKQQGIDLAKDLPDNKKALELYFNTKTNDKKSHSLKYYWITSVIKDVCLKAISIGLTTLGIVYIVVQGSNDYSLLLLALVNIIMFISFGLISLTNSYDFVNNQYIPYINERVKEKGEFKNDWI